jgi:hypothetical protein
MKLEYADGLYAALKDAQVDFVAYLPDDQLYDAARQRGRAHKTAGSRRELPKTRPRPR